MRTGQVELWAEPIEVAEVGPEDHHRAHPSSTSGGGDGDGGSDLHTPEVVESRCGDALAIVGTEAMDNGIGAVQEVVEIAGRGAGQVEGHGAGVGGLR